MEQNIGQQPVMPVVQNQNVQPQQQPQPQQPNNVQPQQVQTNQVPQQVNTDNPRTSEQFDKLLENNKRLYEANEQMKQQMQELTQSLTQPTQAPVPIPQKINPAEFVTRDPVTGESWIDGDRLQKTIVELEERAKKAEQTVEKYVKTSEEREVRRQEAEAMAAHPEMNPENENYNKDFVRRARGLVLDSVMYSQDYGGKPLSFKEAADQIKAGYMPGQTVNPQQPSETQPSELGQVPQGVQEQQPQVTPQGQPVQMPSQTAVQQQPGQPAPANPAQQAKANASAHVTSQPQNAPSVTDSQELESLRYASRRGDDSAIAARLANVDHVIPFNGAGPTQ